MVAKQLNINSIIFHGRFSATERSVHSSPFRRRPALVLSTSTLYQIDFSRFFGHVDEHLTSTSIKFFVMMPRRNGMLCFEALSISEKCTKKERGRFALGLGNRIYTFKTVSGKSAVISENQTATSDGERGMPSSNVLLSLSVYWINLKCRNLNRKSPSQFPLECLVCKL